MQLAQHQQTAEIRRSRFDKDLWVFLGLGVFLPAFLPPIVSAFGINGVFGWLLIPVVVMAFYKWRSSLYITLLHDSELSLVPALRPAPKPADDNAKLLEERGFVRQQAVQLVVSGENLLQPTLTLLSTSQQVGIVLQSQNVQASTRLSDGRLLLTSTAKEVSDPAVLVQRAKRGNLDALLAMHEQALQLFAAHGVVSQPTAPLVVHNALMEREQAQLREHSSKIGKTKMPPLNEGETFTADRVDELMTLTVPQQHVA